MDGFGRVKEYGLELPPLGHYFSISCAKFSLRNVEVIIWPLKVIFKASFQIMTFTKEMLTIGQFSWLNIMDNFTLEKKLMKCEKTFEVGADKW